MRTLGAGVAIAWAIAFGMAATVVAASPWFLDSFAWFAGLAWGVAGIGGLLLGLLLLPLRDTRPVRALAARCGALLAAIALAGVALFVWSSTRSYRVEDERHKVVVVGLDGATYDIIDPMIADGKLPNLAHLLRDGASAELISIEPTISPALWTEIATGKLRARHGIINFRSIQASLQAKRFFDIAHDAGHTIGMMDWLVSWPPLIGAEPGSFWVPDHTARGPETVPARLGFLQALVGATRNDRDITLADRLTWGVDALLSGLRLSTLADAAVTVVEQAATNPSQEDRIWRLQLIGLRLYRDLFLALRAEERPDLSAIVFYPTDALAHKYWKYFEPEAFPDTDAAEVARYGHVIPAAYEASDQALGEILRSVDDRTTVLVVSDHGSQAMQGGQELRFPRLKGEALAAFLGVADRMDVTGIGNELILTPRADASPAEAAAAAAALPELLALLTGARLDGYEAEPFVVDHMDREGDSGDYLGVAFNLGVELTGDDAFDVMLRLPDGRSIDLRELVAQDFSISGGHHLRGIVIARGPGVRRGERVPDASLLDVAPTVLYELGLPVAEDMDGQVMRQLYQPAWTADHPIETVASYGGFGDELATGEAGEMTPALRERLEALGYISE